MQDVVLVLIFRKHLICPATLSALVNLGNHTVLLKVVNYAIKPEFHKYLFARIVADITFTVFCIRYEAQSRLCLTEVSLSEKTIILILVQIFSIVTTFIFFFILPMSYHLGLNKGCQLRLVTSLVETTKASLPASTHMRF